MPTLRHRFGALIGAVIVLITVFAGGTSALAQTGYPPGVPQCTAGDINAGNLLVGQTAVFVLCGPFTTGATVTVSINGTVILTKTSTDGAVRVTVHRTSATTASVDDPVNVATVCGSNTVTATGTGTSGAATTANGTFTIQCAATTPPSSGGLAFTGANAVLTVIVATVLIALGALLLIFQRRRRQTL